MFARKFPGFPCSSLAKEPWNNTNIGNSSALFREHLQAARQWWRSQEWGAGWQKMESKSNTQWWSLGSLRFTSGRAYFATVFEHSCLIFILHANILKHTRSPLITVAMKQIHSQTLVADVSRPLALNTLWLLIHLPSSLEKAFLYSHKWQKLC